MPSFKLNGQQLSDVQVVKLSPDQAKGAVDKLNSADQGADDVLFEVGGDTYVASGRNMLPGRGIAAKPELDPKDIEVTLDGKKARVIAADNQANNGLECLKWTSAPALGGGAAVMLGLQKFFGLAMFTPWSLAAGGAIAGGLLLGSYMYGTHRKFDLSKQAEAGTVVQQNTQSPGGWLEAIKSLFTRG